MYLKMGPTVYLKMGPSFYLIMGPSFYFKTCPSFYFEMVPPFTLKWVPILPQNCFYCFWVSYKPDCVIYFQLECRIRQWLIGNVWWIRSSRELSLERTAKFCRLFPHCLSLIKFNYFITRIWIRWLERKIYEWIKKSDNRHWNCFVSNLLTINLASSFSIFRCERFKPSLRTNFLHWLRQQPRVQKIMTIWVSLQKLHLVYCKYTHAYVYIYIHTYIHIRIHKYINILRRVSIYEFIHIFIYITSIYHIYVYKFIFIYM